MVTFNINIMNIRSTKTISQAIYESTKDKNGVELSNSLNNVINFLHKNQLLGKSKEILKNLEDIINKKEDRIKGKVTSSRDLTEKLKEELENNLRKRYKAKEILLDYSKDEKLIDGLKIEIKDEIIDLSLAHRLNKLQTHLIKN